MISKLKDSVQLIGGYNPLSWQPYNSHVNSKGSWQLTLDSFLFSFTKKEALARVKNNNVCVWSSFWLWVGFNYKA